MTGMGLLTQLFKKKTEGTDSSKERILEIIAVTGPEGISGVKNLGGGLWEAGIMLTAWRLCDTSAPVYEETRRLSMEMDEERLKWAQQMIKKDSVVRLKVREIAGGFKLQDLVEGFCTDVEMQEILSRQQEPVYYEDAVLGVFKLNKASGVFEQTLGRNGMEVKLLFAQDEAEKMQVAMETLQTIVSNLDFWAESAGNYAVSRLLELKNESWRAEGEEEVTGDILMASIWLNDIQAMQGGKFRLWYSDGGMFGGHAVYVDGNIYGRFSDAGVSA